LKKTLLLLPCWPQVFPLKKTLQLFLLASGLPIEKNTSALAGLQPAFLHLCTKALSPCKPAPCWAQVFPLKKTLLLLPVCNRHFCAFAQKP
jgi:hypothetical protein